MSSTVLTLLAETIYGVASGNYDGSSQEFFGNAAKGVAYYHGQGSLQTVIIQVTEFEGTITIQGSLNNDSASASWLDLYEYGSAIWNSSVITDYHPVNLIGNFAWIRIKVTDFDSGKVNNISITY